MKVNAINGSSLIGGKDWKGSEVQVVIGYFLLKHGYLHGMLQNKIACGAE